MAEYLRSARRLMRREEKGNVGITFGMMSCVMLCSIGAAVDFGRAFNATDKLQAASDAAATAAAAAMNATTAEKVQIAKNYLTENNAGSFGDIANVSVTVDGANVNVKATANVPAAFSKMLGVDTIPIVAESVAGYTGQEIEVAMMIDVTGSMGSVRNGLTKIQGLKQASGDLLNIFFPNNARTSGQVRIGIVPMADYVNAGQYASAATGLPTRGYYANVSNLKSTKQGPFSGGYSGSYGATATAQPTGSQHGSTSASAATGGATFNNNYCADPYAPPTPITQMTYSNTGVPAGLEVTGTGARPAQLLTAGSTGFYKVNAHDNTGSDQGWEYFSGTDGDGIISNNSQDPDKITGNTRYYVPLPASITGVEYLKDSATGLLIGIPAYIGASGGYYPQIKQASSYRLSTNDATIKNGYKKITGFSNGNFTLASGSVSTGYFIPVPVSAMNPASILPGCTSSNDSYGYLVSCVTERTGTNRYTDESPSNGGNVGPYNQAAPGRLTNKVNYSEDGICYSAGRKLPEIIPLTNSRDTLEAFFNIPDNELIGGSTPGHLGHAWAWYMLSPKWNGVWPSGSRVADYTDGGTKKYAIIMTDGEYNTQYSDANSATQALALCQGMRDAGITIFTIGFGFSSNASDTAAADLLRQCVNNESGSYFFPYDSAALKTAFQQIGAKISGGATKLVVSK